MKIKCQGCDKLYDINESFFGRKVQCTECGYKMVLREADVIPAEPPPPQVPPPSHHPAFQQRPQYRSAAPPSQNKGVMIGLITVVAVSLVLCAVFSTQKPGDKTITDGDENEAAPINWITPLSSEVDHTPSPAPQAQQVTQSRKAPVNEAIPQVSPPLERPPSLDLNKLVIIRPDEVPTQSKPSRKTLHLSDRAITRGFDKTVTPYFEQHCVECHGPDKEKGDLRVDLLLSDLRGDYAASHLQNIIDEISIDNMPPSKKPRPDAERSNEVISLIESLIESEKNKHQSGGGRPVRRLTRTEFVNIAKDFYGVDLSSSTLPNDLHIGEYENDASLLSTSDLLVENYMDAARAIAREFIAERSTQGTKSYDFFKQYEIQPNKEPADIKSKSMISKFSILATRGRPLSVSFTSRLNSVFQKSRRNNMSFWESLEEPFAMTMFSVESLFIFEDHFPGKEQVSGLELVNRLSFALWRSAPDVALVRLGRSNDILKPEVMREQVLRMMEDPKFDRFITDFTHQWLELGRQEEIAVEERVYPNFNPAIKPSMRQETIAFYRHLVEQNLPMTNFIDSDFLMLNEEMAKYYGIKGVKGKQFRPVKRDGSKAAIVRGGILTHAGILMQGSSGERSHIVERGAFIARKLINDPPSDPPPNVEALPSDGEQFATMTGAQLLNHHLSNPVCAQCHSRIDPLGVPLENYDVTGKFRQVERLLNPKVLTEEKFSGPQVLQLPLQTQAEYYNGEELNGVMGLKRALMSRKQDLGRAYVEALISYTNGRKASLSDAAIVDQIIAETEQDNFPARDIIKKLMLSDMMLTL